MEYGGEAVKAISFLGTTLYSETTYVDGDKECQTKLFPVALCQFKRPSALLVMVTNKAREMWLDELQQRLQPLGVMPTPIDIPDGHSVDDLWDVFDKLTANMQEEEEVVFDITHSFRTLPFLSFLAASYLRVARRVNLKGVYYGAFEARQPASNPPQPTDRAPVFDLSPFMNLLEWTTATDQFLKTGNARELANILQNTQDTLRRASWGQGDLPQKLKVVASSLKTVSQALALTRPREVLPAAAKLGEQLTAAGSDVTQWAKPFAVLLERTRSDYQPLALAQPDDDLAQNLATQWRLIDWYLDRQQVIQAVTLAREWVVSVLCWKLDKEWLDRDNRSSVEDALNAYTRQKQGRSFTFACWQDDIAALPQADTLADLWGKLSEVRNTIAHCGMDKQSIPAQTLFRNVLAFREPLRACAESFGLLSLEATP
jgi:hypothetical protein